MSRKSGSERRIFFIKLGVFALAIAAAITLYFVPILTVRSHNQLKRSAPLRLLTLLCRLFHAQDTICARHTLCVVIVIITMWVTEIAPVWASSLLVPVLVVWLSVYQEPNQPNQAIPAKDAAKRAASTFFSSTVMLAFGAFTISSALTKKQLSDRFVPHRRWVSPVLTQFVADWRSPSFDEWVHALSL